MESVRLSENAMNPGDYPAPKHAIVVSVASIINLILDHDRDPRLDNESLTDDDLEIIVTEIVEKYRDSLTDMDPMEKCVRELLEKADEMNITGQQLHDAVEFVERRNH